MIPTPASCTSPGNFLGMQILMLHVRLTESETLGLGAKQSVFTNSPGDPQTHSGLEALEEEGTKWVHRLFRAVGCFKWQILGLGQNTSSFAPRILHSPGTRHTI